MTKAQQLVHRAKRAQDQAQNLFSDAVQKAYPIGSRVRVQLGRASVVGRVVGHGSSWSRPGDVFIENENTGKRRTFYASYVGHAPEVLS